VGYAELVPAPALRPLVACTWRLAGPASAHRVLPDGCIDVLVTRGGARVVGTMRRAIVAPAHDGAVIGIRFRPGEAARLLPAASRELTDLDALLEQLWGEPAHALEGALGALLEEVVAEGLASEQLLQRASAIVDAALRRRLASHGEAVDVRVRAATAMLEAGSTVREVAARVALSERQLARRFTERVGIPPKVFARVMRLQRAAVLLYQGTAPCEAATLAGYADQAHFTREAAELAGITPGGLARELSDSFKTAVPLAS
jgi:AraC-like DNA-binding protein